MASHRVNKDTAELVAIPPTTWYVKKVSWLLSQEIIVKNIENVPLNEELLESVKRDKILNPLLTMPNWYPIVGSQRVRACWELLKTNPEHPTLNQDIRIAVFDKEYWNMFYLWGDEDFRSKAIAVWFQMVELAWKSQFYIENTDTAGVDMKRFEDIGDELKWNFSDEQRERFSSIRNDATKK